MVDLGVAFFVTCVIISVVLTRYPASFAASISLGVSVTTRKLHFLLNFYKIICLLIITLTQKNFI